MGDYLITCNSVALILTPRTLLLVARSLARSLSLSAAHQSWSQSVLYMAAISWSCCPCRTMNWHRTTCRVVCVCLCVRAREL